MTDPIDFTKMPYDEAVAMAIRLFGIGIAQAEERISIMQGLVSGDVITSEESLATKGGRGSGNWRHAGIPGHVGGSAPAGGALASRVQPRLPGMGHHKPAPRHAPKTDEWGFQYPLKSHPENKSYNRVRIAGKRGSEWIKEADEITAAGRKKLIEELRKDPTLDEDKIFQYTHKLGTHRRYVIEAGLEVAQKYHLGQREQAELMKNLVHHDTIDKYDPKIAAPYIRQMMTKNADQAYWDAVNLHHDVNSHHAEYWVDKKTGKPKQVPTITLIEMAADWRATSRYFDTPLDSYYRKYGEKRADSEFHMHPRTRQAAERELGITDNPFPSLYPEGFKEYGPGMLPSMGIEAVLGVEEPGKKPQKSQKRWGNKPKRSQKPENRAGFDANPQYKGGTGSGNWRHAGIPGQVGGSAAGGGLGALTSIPDVGLQRWSETDAQEAHADFQGEPSWKAWHNKLTDDQAWAINRYVGKPGDHFICDNMNDGLRKGTFDPDADPQSEMSRVYRELDQAVNAGRLHKNAVVYRTIDFEPMYNAAGTGKFSPGHVISDKGFCSTSPRKNTATRWVQMGWVKNPVMFKIKAPKGSKGAYVSWKEKIDNPYMDDSEFLMPRRQRFRIDGVSEETINGRRVVVYELSALR